MLILGFLCMYFDTSVVFFTISSLLFRLAMAVLCSLWSSGYDIWLQSQGLWVQILLLILTIYVSSKIWTQDSLFYNLKRNIFYTQIILIKIGSHLKIHFFFSLWDSDAEIPKKNSKSVLVNFFCKYWTIFDFFSYNFHLWLPWLL